jgi:hypothetical protein
MSAGPPSTGPGAPVRARGSAAAKSATVRVMTVPLMAVLVTAVRAGRGRAVPALGWSEFSPYARRGAGLVRGQAA